MSVEVSVFSAVKLFNLGRIVFSSAILLVGYKIVSFIVFCISLFSKEPYITILIGRGQNGKEWKKTPGKGQDFREINPSCVLRVLLHDINKFFRGSLPVLFYYVSLVSRQVFILLILYLHTGFIFQVGNLLSGNYRSVESCRTFERDISSRRKLAKVAADKFQVG